MIVNERLVLLGRSPRAPLPERFNSQMAPRASRSLSYWAIKFTLNPVIAKKLFKTLEIYKCFTNKTKNSARWQKVTYLATNWLV